MGYRWLGDRGLALSLIVIAETTAESAANDLQYGLEEGAARVLGVLAEQSMPATFVLSARALERAPFLAASLRAGGHEVCAVGPVVVDTAGAGDQAERERIRETTVDLQQHFGRVPCGWFFPAASTTLTRRLLAESGYLYCLDGYSCDEPVWDRHVAAPLVSLSWDAEASDLMLARSPAMLSHVWLQQAIDTFDGLLKESVARPRMLALAVHLPIIGRPGRIQALARFLRHAGTASGVWRATCEQIAREFQLRSQPR